MASKDKRRIPVVGIETIAQRQAGVPEAQICRTCVNESRRWQHLSHAERQVVFATKDAEIIAAHKCRPTDERTVVEFHTDGDVRLAEVVDPNLRIAGAGPRWVSYEPSPDTAADLRPQPQRLATVASCGYEVARKCRNCMFFAEDNVQIPRRGYDGPDAPVRFRPETRSGHCIRTDGCHKIRRSSARGRDPSCLSCAFLMHSFGNMYLDDFTEEVVDLDLDPYERFEALTDAAPEERGLAYGRARWAKFADPSGAWAYFRARLLAREPNQVLIEFTRTARRRWIHDTPTDGEDLANFVQVEHRGVEVGRDVAVRIQGPHWRRFGFQVDPSPQMGWAKPAPEEPRKAWCALHRHHPDQGLNFRNILGDRFGKMQGEADDYDDRTHKEKPAIKAGREDWAWFTDPIAHTLHEEQLLNEALATRAERPGWRERTDWRITRLDMAIEGEPAGDVNSWAYYTPEADRARFVEALDEKRSVTVLTPEGDEVESPMSWRWREYGYENFAGWPRRSAAHDAMAFVFRDSTTPPDAALAFVGYQCHAHEEHQFPVEQIRGLGAADGEYSCPECDGLLFLNQPDTEWQVSVDLSVLPDLPTKRGAGKAVPRSSQRWLMQGWLGEMSCDSWVRKGSDPARPVRHPSPGPPTHPTPQPRARRYGYS